MGQYKAMYQEDNINVIQHRESSDLQSEVSLVVGNNGLRRGSKNSYHPITGTTMFRCTESIDIIYLDRANSMPPEEKECRICLMGEDEGRMVNPCMCNGSAKHVHVQCLSEWIRLKMVPPYTSLLRCEVCSESYIYELSMSQQISISRFILNRTHYKLQYYAFGVLVLAMLGFLIFLVSLLSCCSNKEGPLFRMRVSYISSPREQTLLVCGVLVLAILLIISICMFISEFCLVSKVEVSTICNRDSPLKIKRPNRTFF